MSNIDTISLYKKCEECGSDNWMCIDDDNFYTEICINCCHINEITKIDYLRNFQCPECGCLTGTIEENDKLLAIRCNHCDKQIIMLEKHTTDNRRHVGAIPQQPKTYKEYQKEQNSTPTCPKCGCTEFVPLRKKWSFLTGFATNKVEMVCKQCGWRNKREQMF